MDRSERPRGVALVLVLFVTALLTILVLEFAYSMQVYAAVSVNGRDELQLRAALQSGLATAEQLLLDDVLQDVADDVHLDHPGEPWGEELSPIKLGDATATVTLVDEAGKFPLSTLVEYTIEEGQVVDSVVNDERREQLRRLFDALDLDVGLVDVLVDWMDHDDAVEPKGAEQDAYAPMHRSCRNGPLANIAELEGLIGFTPEMVWGDPDDDEHPGLAEVCTVYGRDDGLINANTAPEIVLAALTPYDDVAREIVRARERDPFVTTADINDRVSDTSITQYLTTESGVWSVRVVAETARSERPLRLMAEGVLARYRDDEGGAQSDAAAEPTPGRNNADRDDDENTPMAGIEVLAWREVR